MRSYCQHLPTSWLRAVQLTCANALLWSCCSMCAAGECVCAVNHLSAVYNSTIPVPRSNRERCSVLMTLLVCCADTGWTCRLRHPKTLPMPQPRLYCDLTMQTEMRTSYSGTLGCLHRPFHSCKLHLLAVAVLQEYACLLACWDS